LELLRYPSFKELEKSSHVENQITPPEMYGS
jgi:hypothetical protein